MVWDFCCSNKFLGQQSAKCKVPLWGTFCTLRVKDQIRWCLGWVLWNAHPTPRSGRKENSHQFLWSVFPLFGTSLFQLANVNRTGMGDTGRGTQLSLIWIHYIKMNLKKLLPSDSLPTIFGMGKWISERAGLFLPRFLSVEVLVHKAWVWVLEGVLKGKPECRPSQVTHYRADQTAWVKDLGQNEGIWVTMIVGRPVSWGSAQILLRLGGTAYEGSLYMFGKHLHR